MLKRPVIVVLTFLLFSAVARADESPLPAPAVPDVVYKGLVGKALDAVPMDPDQRVRLQRASAVVNGTLAGRTVAAWAGVANPILLVAGAIWGILSASHIEAPKPVADAEPDRAAPPEPVDAGQTRLASVPVQTEVALETGQAQVPFEAAQTQVALAAGTPREGTNDEVPQ
jgi:hypothetical protein